MRRAAAFAALAAAAPATAAPAPIDGRWLTVGGEAVVEVAPCPADRSAFCGRIVRIVRPRPGGPTVDAKNPDRALRGRPLLGIAILSGFTAAGDHWRGRLYDPDSGRSYRSEVTATGQSLKVKGCLGPFCRTQRWEQAT